jgi:hypothetical protein
METIKSSDFTNIPTNALVVVNRNDYSFRADVFRFNTGVISLTGFALAQFMEGADLEITELEKERINIKSVLHCKKMKLILNMSKSIVTTIHGNTSSMEVDYEDLKILRKWLELRMSHCEKERDARTVWPHNPEVLKFNPDTYIGQKLLLLDLRELMLGEIVE